MIALTLTNYQERSGIYVVKLGNGTTHEFKNLKTCKKFLSESSRFLTKHYNEINLLFCDVFQLYRQIYYYFDNNRSTRKSQLHETRRRINALLNASEDIFYNLSFVADFQNANVQAFNLIYNLIDHLTEISVTIRKLNQNKSYASIQISCDYLIQQLRDQRFKIQNYALEKASSFESMPQNLDLFNSANLLKIVS